MKTSNVQTTHPMAIIRGWVDQGLIIRDASTTAPSILDLTIVGGTITDNGDGTGILTIGASGGGGGGGGGFFGGGNGTSIDGMVPFYIPTADTFTVPLYKQGLFTETITADGTLVVDGHLVMVA